MHARHLHLRHPPELKCRQACMYLFLPLLHSIPLSLPPSYLAGAVSPFPPPFLGPITPTRSLSFSGGAPRDPFREGKGRRKATLIRHLLHK